MKNLKILFSVFLLAVFVISCSSSSSDDNSTTVKYQISGLDNAVVQIKYKKADGSIETLTDFQAFGGGTDSKTVSVSNLPFNATLEVTVNNTTPNTKNYTLVIFVNDVAKDFNGVSVPPMTITTGSVDFVAE
jgi:hypothetical protein